MAGSLNEWGRAFWFRLVGLALLDAFAVYSGLVLLDNGSTLMFLGLVLGTLFINWVYLWPRTQALRWITPGLILMAVFVVVPIIFSGWVSLTNWRTGNAQTKEQTITFWESKVYVDPDSGGELFDLYVYVDDASGEYRLLLINPDSGEYLFGKGRPRTDPVVEDAVEATGTFAPDETVPPETLDGYRLLSQRELFALSTRLDFTTLVIDVPQGEVVILGLSQGRVVLASQRYVYDDARDVLVDTVLDRQCPPGTTTETKGNFVCDDGEVLIPGWRAFVGGENYATAFTNTQIQGPFVRVFIWNVVFALFSVGTTFALGLLLAVTLHNERMKGVRFYRSVFIIPYAIPAFLSILVWRGLFNANFGTVNSLLDPVYDLLGMDPIAWITNPTYAKVTVLFVNLWLGFPYMFLLATGALQAIPSDILEAAATDGATGRRAFWKITFPLLMVALAPLLIGSFAFNFNNFNLIFLLTNGGPPVVGAEVPVGHTDILISFTFNIANTTGRGGNYGLASAFTMIIFFLLLMISAFSFRFTKRLEDIYGGL